MHCSRIGHLYGWDSNMYNRSSLFPFCSKQHQLSIKSPAVSTATFSMFCFWLYISHSPLPLASALYAVKIVDNLNNPLAGCFELVLCFIKLCNGIIV